MGDPVLRGGLVGGLLGGLVPGRGWPAVSGRSSAPQPPAPRCGGWLQRSPPDLPVGAFMVTARSGELGESWYFKYYSPTTWLGGG